MTGREVAEVLDNDTGYGEQIWNWVNKLYFDHSDNIVKELIGNWTNYHIPELKTKDKTRKNFS